jgi:hypothetical protein
VRRRPSFHRRDAVAAAGQDLVRITLVADVPDETIVRRVVQPMQRDGELDHAEVRAEMAARSRHRFDQVFAQFARDFTEFGLGKLAQIGGRADAGQARITYGVDHGSGGGEYDLVLSDATTQRASRGMACSRRIRVLGVVLHRSNA